MSTLPHYTTLSWMDNITHSNHNCMILCQYTLFTSGGTVFDHSRFNMLYQTFSWLSIVTPSGLIQTDTARQIQADLFYGRRPKCRSIKDTLSTLSSSDTLLDPVVLAKAIHISILLLSNLSKRRCFCLYLSAMSCHGCCFSPLERTILYSVYTVTGPWWQAACVQRSKHTTVHDITKMSDTIRINKMTESGISLLMIQGVINQLSVIAYICNHTAFVLFLEKTDMRHSGGLERSQSSERDRNVLITKETVPQGDRQGRGQGWRERAREKVWEKLWDRGRWGVQNS